MQPLFFRRLRQGDYLNPEVLGQYGQHNKILIKKKKKKSKGEDQTGEVPH